MHFDLKPANIFLSEDMLLLTGDFGFSQLSSSGNFAKTRKGTAFYMCKEMYNDSINVISYNCDIHSFVMIALKLLNIKNIGGDDVFEFESSTFKVYAPGNTAKMKKYLTSVKDKFENEEIRIIFERLRVFD